MTSEWIDPEPVVPRLMEAMETETQELIRQYHQAVEREIRLCLRTWRAEWGEPSLVYSKEDGHFMGLGQIAHGKVVIRVPGRVAVTDYLG